MTLTRPTTLPATITAGDTVGVTLSFADYPAPTWSLSWALAGVSVLTVASQNNTDGVSHDLDVTAAQTSALGPGTYQMRLRATDGTTVTTIGNGTLTVLPDLGALAAGEGVSWEETTLAVVEAALSNTLTGEMKMYMIAGRQVMTFTPKELMVLRDDLSSRIAALRGDGFGATIRFGYRGLASC